MPPRAFFVRGFLPFIRRRETEGDSVKNNFEKSKKQLAFFRRCGIISDGNALHDKGVIIHEERYSSVLWRSSGALRLR